MYMYVKILEPITIKNKKPTINKFGFTTSINILNVFNNKPPILPNRMSQPNL